MQHQKLLLAIDSLFEGGRMFVGATSVTYLLSAGVSLAEIAALKSIQAAVLIAGEVPTGVLADRFGRKTSLTLGAVSAILGFLLFFFGKTFAIYAIAESLTALSLCFWSGAFEACAIDTAKLEHSESALARFFHLNLSCNSAAVMVLGFAGGALGARGVSLPYLAAAATYGIMLYLITRIPEAPRDPSVPSIGMAGHLKAAIHEGVLHPVLFPFFTANILIQFVIQPLLHYWQPFFQEIHPAITTDQQGTIFMLYCAAISIFGFFYSRASKHAFVHHVLTAPLLFFVFSLLYFALGASTQFPVAVISFIALQGFLSLCRTSLSIKMNKCISSRSRASVLSSLSFISRIGMIAALALIGRTLGDSQTGKIAMLYREFAGISIGLVLLVLVGVVYSTRKSKNAVA